MIENMYNLNTYISYFAAYFWVLLRLTGCFPTAAQIKLCLCVFIGSFKLLATRGLPEAGLCSWGNWPHGFVRNLMSIVIKLTALTGSTGRNRPNQLPLSVTALAMSACTWTDTSAVLAQAQAGQIDKQFDDSGDSPMDRPCQVSQ